MTKEFIENVLSELGESMDTWTPLAEVAQIGLLGDRFVYLDPTYRMVYFSSDGSLYVKKLTGQISELVGTTVPDNAIAFEKDGKTYVNFEEPHGIDTPLGKIHTIIDFDNITGFYKKYDGIGFYMKYLF